MIKNIHIDDIIFDDENPKTHVVKEIEKSLSMHGLVELPVVDERTGKLVVGHGRVKALRAFKARGDRPEGVDASWEIPVLVWNSVDDTQAKDYLLRSNRLTEMGGWDMDGVAAMVEEYLLDMDGVFDGLVVDLPDLSGEDDGLDLAEDPPEVKKKTIICPKCGYEW